MRQIFVAQALFRTSNEACKPQPFTVFLAQMKRRLAAIRFSYQYRKPDTPVSGFFLFLRTWQVFSPFVFSTRRSLASAGFSYWLRKRDAVASQFHDFYVIPRR